MGGKVDVLPQIKIPRNFTAVSLQQQQQNCLEKDKSSKGFLDKNSSSLIKMKKIRILSKQTFQSNVNVSKTPCPVIGRKEYYE